MLLSAFGSDDDDDDDEVDDDDDDAELAVISPQTITPPVVLSGLSPSNKKSNGCG